MQQTPKTPKLSVLTPSLNHGRFLREMIESVLNQSFTDYEHIVVDGGSTDNTIEILKEYPHIRWISEEDESPYEAIRKALSMARGEYIIQSFTSEGFLYKDWFKRCVEILDNDREVSLVWGATQYMSEEGILGRVTDVEFLAELPPQKKYFIAYWLNTGDLMHEINQCIRKEVFDICFPKDTTKGNSAHRSAHFDMAYNFNTRGYLPYFIPVIANFGRVHKDSCGQSFAEINMNQFKIHMRKVASYRKQLFRGKVKHYFRDGSSQIIGEITKQDLRIYKRRFYKIKLKLIMNHTIYELVRFILRKLHLYKLREWLMSW